MALKRMDKKLERSGPALKRTEKKIVRRDITGMHANPLQFIQPAPNPLANVDKAGAPEEVLTAEQRALKDGFIARAKAEKFRFDETLRADYYFGVVFEHGSQAVAFLEACEYRDTNAQFIDGMILAKAMGIELPPTPFKLRPLRSADKSLQHLVTSIPSRSEIKRSPG